MARITYFREPIWPWITGAVEALKTQRDGAATPGEKAGLNFSIILNSTCAIEGILESGLKALLEVRVGLFYDLQEARADPDRKRTVNLFFQRIETHLSERISSTTGAENYSAMFELITGQSLSGLKHVLPIWETICVLFQFRNVLGHGRQVSAEQLEAYYIEGVKETFGGGYRKVQDYLLKKKLLDCRFTERHSDLIYLSDVVADHFATVAVNFRDAVTTSLEGDDKIAFEHATVSH